MTNTLPRRVTLCNSTGKRLMVLSLVVYNCSSMEGNRYVLLPGIGQDPVGYCAVGSVGEDGDLYGFIFDEEVGAIQEAASHSKYKLHLLN